MDTTSPPPADFPRMAITRLYELGQPETYKRTPHNTFSSFLNQPELSVSLSTAGQPGRARSAIKEKKKYRIIYDPEKKGTSVGIRTRALHDWVFCITWITGAKQCHARSAMLGPISRVSSRIIARFSCTRVRTTSLRMPPLSHFSSSC